MVATYAHIGTSTVEVTALALFVHNSHSFALSGQITGEHPSIRSLDNKTSSVLNTCASPVPTAEECLESCADEFPAILCHVTKSRAKILAIANRLAKSRGGTHRPGLSSLERSLYKETSTRMKDSNILYQLFIFECDTNVWIWFTIYVFSHQVLRGSKVRWSLRAAFMQMSRLLLWQ